MGYLKKMLLLLTLTLAIYNVVKAVSRGENYGGTGLEKRFVRLLESP